MYSHCSICPGTHNCLQGDGSHDSRYFIIGERPGQHEERVGKVFIGDAGQELDRLYLLLAGIGRHECWVTNVVQCANDTNKKPTQKEIDSCAPNHLARELAEVNPRIVMLMGATACSLVDGLDLSVEHGIPFKGKLFGWEGFIVAMYHPAAGLHQTALMIPLLDDWRRLGAWLQRPIEHGSGTRVVDYRLVRSVEDVGAYFRGFDIGLGMIGVDTETHDGEPYSIQVSVQSNTGIMLKLGGDASWDFELANWLEQYTLILHNAPADLPIVEKIMSGWWAMPKYRDSMQEAYQFQNLPQALKALAYRLLHKRRRSWDQVVGPPSRAVLKDWLLDAVVKAEGERQVIPQLGKKGQPIKPKIINSPYERALNGIMTHLSKSETYDPWKRITPEMDEKFGRAPRKGVRWCEEQELIEYAVSDASDCLELALLFDRMREEIVKKEWAILEEDCDDIGTPVCTTV